MAGGSCSDRGTRCSHGGTAGVVWTHWDWLGVDAVGERSDTGLSPLRYTVLGMRSLVGDSHALAGNLLSVFSEALGIVLFLWKLTDLSVVFLDGDAWLGCYCFVLCSVVN